MNQNERDYAELIITVCLIAWFVLFGMAVIGEMLK